MVILITAGGNVCLLLRSYLIAYSSGHWQSKVLFCVAVAIVGQGYGDLRVVGGQPRKCPRVVKSNRREAGDCGSLLQKGVRTIELYKHLDQTADVMIFLYTNPLPHNFYISLLDILLPKVEEK